MLLFLMTSVHALTLEEACAAVEQQSEEVQMLHEQRRQSDLYVPQAWALLSPRISVAGNYTINEKETTLDFSKSFPDSVLQMIEGITGEPVSFGDPVVINQKSYFDANFTISQPLISAKSLPGLPGAYALVDAGEAQEQASLAQLRNAVANFYWAVLLAREGETVAKEAYDHAVKRQAQANALVAQGSATKTLSLQAEIAALRADRDLSAANARRVQAEELLARLTGVSPDEALSPPQTPEMTYQNAEDAIADAIASRPELRVAEAQAKAARMQALSSKLSWIPTLDGRFTELWTQNSGFSGEANTWNIAFNATWVLWDGGSRAVDNFRTASVARSADEMASKLSEETVISVKAAYAEIMRSKLALTTVDREVALAEENARLADLSFAAGAMSFLESEDARVGLSAARLSSLSEHMHYDLAVRELLRLTGRL